MTNQRDFEDRVVLVTGGASGIGRATAVELARRGAAVAIADRKRDAARDTAELCLANHGATEAFEFDQASAEGVTEMVTAVQSRFGRIDGLFANAGFGKFKPILDIPVKDWDLTIQINLNGTFYVCQEVARVMARQTTGGRMVLTASSGARSVIDQVAPYDVAKAGVVMLAKHLASELGTYRISVNTILPGVIATGMTGPMLDRPEWRNMLRRETPVGRWGEASEVAALVAFLLSEAAAYINGAEILIDGGSTLHGYPRWFALNYAKPGRPDWERLLSHYPYGADQVPEMAPLT